jgi:predicted protein tyrosine phosphatase
MESLFTRLNVMGVEDLSEIFVPLAEKSRGGVKRNSIGAIISIEHYPADSSRPNEPWRLAEPTTENVPRHWTRLFYSDHHDDRGLKDLFNPLDGKGAPVPHKPAWIKDRAVALSETLQFAQDFLLDESKKGKKLIVHCNRGEYRSPALTLAVLSHMLIPGQSEENVVEILKGGICASRPPKLRIGELAFLDAFFNLDGKLITAWVNVNPRTQFDEKLARQRQQEFSAVLNPEGEHSLRPEVPAGRFHL